MNEQEARRLVQQTFNRPYDEGQFRLFVKNLFKDFTEKREGTIAGNYIWDAFSGAVSQYRRLGKFVDPEGLQVDVLAVKLKKESLMKQKLQFLTKNVNFLLIFVKNFNFQQQIRLLGHF
jgi:hypothetical protein